MNQPRCPVCGAPEELVWVHGHGQCRYCHTNVAPCCDGENNLSCPTPDPAPQAAAPRRQAPVKNPDQAADREEEFGNLSAAHAPLLELTARLFIQELDAAAIDSLLHPDIEQLLEVLEPGVTSYLRSRRPKDALPIHQDEDLAAEFCRLFLMSKATSPMLSVWFGEEQIASGTRLSGLIGGWQAELGVEMADGAWGNLPKDHVSVGLGVFALALIADENRPPEDRLAKVIWRTLLADTVPGFVKAVLEHSENPAYRAGAKLARELVVDAFRKD